MTPTKKKATTTTTETTQAEVKDATELISSRPPKKIPDNSFYQRDFTSQTARPQNEDITSGTNRQPQSVGGNSNRR